jgi:hypothetical protein
MREIVVNQIEKLKFLGDNLTSSLKDKFIALYHATDLSGADYSSSPSTWIIVNPQTDLQLVRQVYLDFQKKYRDEAIKGPAVATSGDVELYQRLYPMVIKKVLTPDNLIVGRDILGAVSQEHPPNPLIQSATIAAEAMFCSALLAPSSLSQETQSDLTYRLSNLVSGLDLEIGNDLIDTLSNIHRFIEDNQADDFQWQGQPAGKEPPSHLPNALSLYGFKHYLVVVLPQVNRITLSGIDWESVAQLVSDEYDSILLATPSQLLLAACVRLAVDIAIFSFEHIWGADILSGCIPGEQDILTSILFKPMQVLVKDIPSAYCTISEEALGLLVHDTQNILHNIQLQNEILARRDSSPPFTPPDPLPGKEIPNHQRMAAIIDHFRWWVDYLKPAN